MPDQPDEVQKPPRRSAALPPFFAPRTTRPNTPVQSGSVISPRRSSPLFTPPSVPKQPRPSTPAAAPAFPPSLAPPASHPTPFAPPVLAPPVLAPPVLAPPVLAPPVLAPPVLAPAFVAGPLAIEAEPRAPDSDITRSEEVSFAEPAIAEEPVVAPPLVEQALAPLDDASLARGSVASAPAPGDSLVIEQFEHAPISLRPTGEHTAVQNQSTLSSLEYGDAERVHADESDMGGLEIERTELTLEPTGDTSRLEVESFWSAEPMRASEPPAQALERASDYAAAEHVVDPFDAHEPPRVSAALPEPVVEASVVEEAAQEPPVGVVPLAEAPSQPSAAHEAQPPVSPAQPADDAEAALEEAFAAPATLERPPRWATPRVVDAIARAPDAISAPIPPVAGPADELSDALGWPHEGDEANATGATHERDAAHADVPQEFSTGLAGWRGMPPASAGAPGLAMSDAVAAALERIAGRVRAGEVPLPGDVALAASDESALAVALAALLRGDPRG